MVEAFTASTSASAAFVGRTPRDVWTCANGFAPSRNGVVPRRDMPHGQWGSGSPVLVVYPFAAPFRRHGFPPLRE